jgi:hypothetical protein
MTKDESKAVAAIIANALKAAGYIVEKSSTTYTPDASSTFRVVVNKVGGLTSDEKAYDLHQRMLDLPARGTAIIAGGKRLTICGFRPAARKAPIILADATGNKYVMAISTVKLALREAA